MRKRKSVGSTASAQVLESRALLAATLTDGVLSIEGTDDADIIKVRVVEADVEDGDGGTDMDVVNEPTAVGDTVVVTDNGETFEFPADDVESIVITTGEGNDKVYFGKEVEISAEVDAGTGDDWVKTGGGDDVVIGGEGNDRLYTRDGNDSVDAGDGDDNIAGGRGGDTLTGGLGDDRISAGRGADIVEGGDGNDAIGGDADDDTLIGGGGNDRISAGGGNNEVVGGDGDDTLFGNSNNDTLDGGEGENQVVDQVDKINEMVDLIFERFNENADDFLTEDEIGTSFFSRFSEDVDADADGQISRDELGTAITDKVAERMDQFGGRRGRGGFGGGFGRGRGDRYHIQ